MSLWTLIAVVLLLFAGMVVEALAQFVARMLKWGYGKLVGK